MAPFGLGRASLANNAVTAEPKGASKEYPFPRWTRLYEVGKHPALLAACTLPTWQPNRQNANPVLTG